MIEKTQDKEAIRAILCHPKIWPMIADDESPADFDPPINEDYYYLRTLDPDPTGLFIYHWFDEDTLETHHHVLPEFRGVDSINYSMESVKWVFENTGAKRLVCSIPNEYPNVIAHAKKGGFKDWYESKGVHWLKLERDEWVLSES